MSTALSVFLAALIAIPAQNEPIPNASAEDVPAAPVVGLTPADLYAVGEEAGWVFEQNGRRIGENWFRYEGPTDLDGRRLHHFSTGIQLDAMPRVMPKSDYLTDLWVDDGGHPVRHLLHARLGDVDSELELSIADTACTAHLVQGGVPTDFDLTVPEDAFLQLNNAIGYFELMLALQPPPAAGGRSYTLFSTNGLTAFPYEARHVSDAEQEGFVLEDSLGQTIVMDSSCRKLRSIIVEAQGIVIRRADEALEHVEFDEADEEEELPQFDSEEVVIRHGEVSLAGTVTRPPQGKPPFPAIFFVSGSGPQDRHGRSSGLEIGTREILDRLTSDGFLVLRVDDRGVGASTGPTEHMTFDDLVADARACMNHLFEREDVDPTRIALIGHSEGGVTVPLLAVERPDLAAIVLMAAPGRTLMEVMLEQNATALDDQDIAPEEREETLEQVRRLFEWVSSGEEQPPDDLPDELLDKLPPLMLPWLRSHARQDPTATIQLVTCPVLVLQGAKDFQVSAEADTPALAAALAEAGRSEHELIVFPDLDHLFKPVEGEVSRLPDYYVKRAVDEGFLATLSAWLSDRLQPQD